MRDAASSRWQLAALLLLCAAAQAGVQAAPRGRLLRVPKVYNALITSNEPLLPSRTEQATVGQVLYYPPHHTYPASTYPASAGPLILPQVPQAPTVYDPSQAQQGGQGGPPLELHVQPGLTQEQVALAQEQQEQQAEAGNVTPWPVVYASDVQQQQQQQQQQQDPEEPQQQPATFPAARAVQTVREVAHPGEYQPPPAVDIDSIKNNRPTGIQDVPPPPLPVSRGDKGGHRPQPVPPGLLPF